MVIHLGIPSVIRDKFFRICDKRILHDKKFNLSTDTKYVNCKRCCKRVGMDATCAIPKRARKKATIDDKLNKIFKTRHRENFSLI